MLGICQCQNWAEIRAFPFYKLTHTLARVCVPLLHTYYNCIIYTPSMLGNHGNTVPSCKDMGGAPQRVCTRDLANPASVWELVRERVLTELACSSPGCHAFSMQDQQSLDLPGCRQRGHYDTLLFLWSSQGPKEIRSPSYIQSALLLHNLPWVDCCKHCTWPTELGSPWLSPGRSLRHETKGDLSSILYLVCIVVAGPPMSWLLCTLYKTNRAQISLAATREILATQDQGRSDLHPISGLHRCSWPPSSWLLCTLYKTDRAQISLAVAREIFAVHFIDPQHLTKTPQEPREGTSANNTPQEPAEGEQRWHENP